jgi:hypothetical protein
VQLGNFASNMAEKIAGKHSKQRKSPKKQRKPKWKDADVKELISLMQEETIIFSMNNAKTSKEKSACYKILHVEMNKKGMQNNATLKGFSPSFGMLFYIF